MGVCLSLLVDKADVKRIAFDRGAMANFSQDNRAIASDANVIAGEMDYVGTLEVDFRAFKVILLESFCSHSFIISFFKKNKDFMLKYRRTISYSRNIQNKYKISENCNK